MTRRQQQNDDGGLLVLVLIGLALWWWNSSGGTITAPDEVTRVSYVYEKDTVTPPELRRALLDSPDGLKVKFVDKDGKNGNGNIPESYKVAISQAAANGVPLVVIEYGERVEVIQDPTIQDIEKLWNSIRST